MKALLVASAAIEAGAAVALLSAPSLFASLLFGAPLGAPISFAISRVAGVALLSLGIASWLAKNESSARAIITAMLIYNLGVAAVLVIAATTQSLQGPALWPAVALHILMAVWCTASLRTRTPLAASQTPTR